MLMGPERKKAVTVIIAGMGGHGEDMESDSEYAMKACASKIMRCFEEKDVSGFCEYMKEFMEMCKEGNNPKPEMEY